MIHRLAVFSVTGLLVISLLLSGCGGEPYTYVPDNELKPGPGLLSGKDGEFTLIGSPRKTGEEEETKQQDQNKQ